MKLKITNLKLCELREEFIISLQKRDGDQIMSHVLFQVNDGLALFSICNGLKECLPVLQIYICFSNVHDRATGKSSHSSFLQQKTQ